MKDLLTYGFFDDSYVDILRFQFDNPYFNTKLSAGVQNQLRMYFKFNNDNNPFVRITVLPDSFHVAFEKIGGYIKVFAIIQFAFYILNKYKFEQKLKKLYLFKHYQH